MLFTFVYLVRALYMRAESHVMNHLLLFTLLA